MVVVVLLIFGAAVRAQEIVTFSTRPGVTQAYFLTSTPKNLQAIAVLFPGSGGLLQLRTEKGQPKFNQGNFLVRSRAEFVKRVSDQCEVTPYGDAGRLADKYPLIIVFGGTSPQSGPCDAFSQHGYLGKEPETVEQIVNWILKKPFEREVK